MELCDEPCLHLASGIGLRQVHAGDDALLDTAGGRPAGLARISSAGWVRSVWLGALLTPLLLLSYAKGFNSSVQAWGGFYWYVDYAEGFIRRGLIGEIMRPLRAYAASSGTSYDVVIASVYHTISLGFFAILVVWAIWIAPRLKPEIFRIFLLGMMLFLVSPLIPIQAFNSGYVDVILMAVTSAAAVLVLRQQYFWAAVLGFAAALSNEASLFQWLSVALLLLIVQRQETSRLRRALAFVAMMAPLLAIAAILGFEVPGAAAKIISGLPFDPAIKKTLIESQYGQSAGGQVGTQIRYLGEYPVNFLISVIYTQIPTMLMVVAVAIMDRHGTILAPLRNLPRNLRIVFYVLYAFAPFSLMAFSWDLSRMMVWTNMSAGLLLLLTAASFKQQASPP